ncbi:MAG: heavy metal-associated domain-containing protein [Rhodococcus sp. (in: high G+C Gram-positive bacteria)]|jgi:copper chaperone|uniref:heavy-metal-associated domain-containing protein n=1 Tax=Nocardiaceae TaxID=85025 RepID=UPI001E50A342|nr:MULTISPECIES: heavy metal-associated domain-containing protein [Rhodococcus]MCC8927917.1 heavy-metal-associated domain-containing protein [Rhodococcus sp. I2R]MCZ4276242.1 heavy metal-associated domain-containing protein [Rhodococcus yunnanensis]
MTNTNYRVSGMTCGHCEASVREEVSAVIGVESATVSASAGTLTVIGVADLDQAEVIAAVREAGYSAEPAPADPRIP